MQHHTQDDGVKLMLKADFEPGKLSTHERDVLRAVLPQLMLELIQSMPDSDDEE